MYYIHISTFRQPARGMDTRYYLIYSLRADTCGPVRKASAVTP